MNANKRRSDYNNIINIFQKEPDTRKNDIETTFK
jgi:hypothetical protein